MLLFPQLLHYLKKKKKIENPAMLLNPDPLRLLRHITPIHIQMISGVFGI